MDRRDRLFRFYRQNPTTASRDIFRAQRNRVVWLQRKAKIQYFHQLISKKSHPSAIWNTLKLVTSSTTSPDNWSSFNADHASIANPLNDHFVSISSSTLSLSLLSHFPPLVHLLLLLLCPRPCLPYYLPPLSGVRRLLLL